MMNKINPDLIERSLDHTLLKPDMTSTDLEFFCLDAMESNVASICIPPVFVKEAVQYVKSQKKICTVIGFPNGYHTSDIKLYEAERALNDGADELDLVIHIGSLLMGDVKSIYDEVYALRRLSDNMVLKVIIETGALGDEDCIRIVKVLNNSGLDFYKTSTGFNFPGSDFHKFELIKTYKNEDISIKVSGGIRELVQAQKYLDAGATRIGSSGLLEQCRKERRQI